MVTALTADGDTLTVKDGSTNTVASVKFTKSGTGVTVVYGPKLLVPPQGVVTAPHTFHWAGLEAESLEDLRGYT